MPAQCMIDRPESVRPMHALQEGVQQMCRFRAAFQLLRIANAHSADITVLTASHIPTLQCCACMSAACEGADNIREDTGKRWICVE